NKKALIILDNCEHIVESAVAIAQQILDRSHSTKIIATSRRSLNVTGAKLWRVPSLSMPPRQAAVDVSIEELFNYDAIQLFLDRAVSVSPEFKLTTDNCRAVLEICTR